MSRASVAATSVAISVWSSKKLGIHQRQQALCDGGSQVLGCHRDKILLPKRADLIHRPLHKIEVYRLQRNASTQPILKKLRADMSIANEQGLQIAPVAGLVDH